MKQVRLRNILRIIILLLDRPGGRWLISIAVPLAAQRSSSGVQKLIYSEGWIHYFRNSIVVEPTPRARNAHLGEGQNQYIWGFLCTPKEGDTLVDVGAGLGVESFYYFLEAGTHGRYYQLK